MVQSFGDGRPMEDEEPEPPFGIPQIAVMLIPVMDADALEDVAEQVRARIADAVRAGFNDAMGDLVVVDDGTPEMPVEVPFDANPTLNSNDQFAYEKYAQRLDWEMPDWWRIPAPHMAAPLREQARIRQAREASAGLGGRSSR